MTIYKIKRVDHGGTISATDDIECKDDGAAIREAFRQLAIGISHGFDIWDGDRLVHRHREHRKRPLV